MAQPPDPSWTPVSLLVGIKGLLVAGGSILGVVFAFATRRDNSRNEARSLAIAERKEALDERTAARVAMEVEIARKDAEILWWKKDSVEGWTGLNNAVLRWSQDNHKADNNEQMLIGIIERAGLVVPKLRKREAVPSAQVLAGRKEEGKGEERGRGYE